MLSVGATLKHISKKPIIASQLRYKTCRIVFQHNHFSFLSHTNDTFPNPNATRQPLQYQNYSTTTLLQERKRTAYLSKKGFEEDVGSISKILLNIDFNDVKSISKAIHNLSKIQTPESGEEALKILENMKNNPDGVQPDVILYNSVINTVAKSGMEDLGKKALSLLQEMHELYHKKLNKSVQPDKITYTSVINALVKGNYKSYSKKSLKLLNEMHHLYNSGNYKPSQRIKIKPCVQTYNAVLYALAKSGEKKCGAKCRKLVDDMYHYSILYHEDDMRPNLLTYNTFMQAYINEKNTCGGTKCEAILREMIDGGVKPNATSYMSIITAYAQTGKPNSGSKAEELLAKMKQDKYMKLDIKVYNTVLNAHIQSKNENIFQIIPELLDEMDVSNIKPNAITYNNIINAYIKMGHEELVDKAMQLLKSMHVKKIKPDLVTYNTIINALRKSNTKDIGTSSESLLREMESLRIKPDVTTYSTIIDAYIKSATTLEECNFAGKKAFELFQEMKDKYKIKPDVVLYGVMMNAIGKSTGSKKKADALFREMETYDIKPNVTIYTSYIDIIAKCGIPDAGPVAKEVVDNMLHVKYIKPNIYTYTALVNAYANTKYDDQQYYKPGQKAVEIHGDVMNLYQTDDVNMEINTTFYNCVINAVSKGYKPNAGDKAKDLLEDMQAFEILEPTFFAPDIITYECVLKAYITSSKLNHDKEAGKKAEKLVKEMNKSFQNGEIDFRPTTSCYVSVMKAYQYSNSYRSAYRILNVMEKDFLEGNVTAKPSVNAYVVVIECWMEERRQDENVILEILESMKRVGIMPNKSLHKSLSTAISSIDDMKTKEKIKRILTEMLQSHSPKSSSTKSPSSQENLADQNVSVG